MLTYLKQSDCRNLEISLIYSEEIFSFQIINHLHACALQICILSDPLLPSVCASRYSRVCTHTLWFSDHSSICSDPLMDTPLQRLCDSFVPRLFLFVESIFICRRRPPQPNRPLAVSLPHAVALLRTCTRAPPFFAVACLAPM